MLSWKHICLLIFNIIRSIMVCGGLIKCRILLCSVAINPSASVKYAIAFTI